LQSTLDAKVRFARHDACELLIGEIDRMMEILRAAVRLVS